MTWTILAPLIAQYGIPWAFEFWKIVVAHPEPTQESWDKLLALSQKTYADYIKDALERAGSPPPPASPS